ncbi:MAG: hypothetical protein AAF639_29810 [Chloroflexota bacterium]
MRLESLAEHGGDEMAEMAAVRPKAVRPAKSAADWDRLIETSLPELDGEYPLTDAQVEEFWGRGFIVLDGVLSPGEIEAYGVAIRDVAMSHFRVRGLQMSFGARCPFEPT